MGANVALLRSAQWDWSVPGIIVDKQEDGMLISMWLQKDLVGFCKPEKGIWILL